MTKYFTLLFLSLFVALQAASVPSDNYDYKNAYSLYDKFYDFSNECKKPGTICKNCKELINCIKVDGDFDEILIQTCNLPTETCLINKCTEDPNPQCGESSGFICHNTGVFPDPFDCHSYHMCVDSKHNLEITTTDEPETSTYEGRGRQLYFYGQRETQDKGMIHIPVKCDENYGYNPVTTYCSKKLNDNICANTPPVPYCEKVGQNGAITGTSIYYICMQKENSLQVNLYMCPHGTKYVNGECI